MRKPSCIVPPLWFRTTLLAVSLTLPIVAQTPVEKGVSDPTERGALQAALDNRDPLARAAALEGFLERYPLSSVRLEALTAAMEAYERAGDPEDAALIANAVLQIQKDNPRALALVASLNSAMSFPILVGDLPADPLARSACQFDQWLRFGQESALDLRYEIILSLRDVSPCNQVAADWVWQRILTRQRVRKAGTFAKILSSTTDTIVAATYYSNYDGEPSLGCESMYCYAVPKRDRPDLRVTLQTPLPYELPFGAKMAIAGTVAGYTVQPFSFAMENGELPDLPEFGCNNSAYGLGTPVKEYFLDHRDATPCTEHAADLIWRQMNGRYHEFSAQVVSATAYDMEAAIVEKDWKSPRKDLHVTFAKPFPFAPRPGPVVRVNGTIKEYETDPFQFRMENGKAPDLICAWVKEVGVASLSFDEWLYVLRTGHQSDCTREAARQVWGALDQRQQQSGTFKLSVRVASAAPRLIEGTLLDAEQDEEIDLQVRMAKPIQHLPAPGAVIDVRGYLYFYHDQMPNKQRPFTLVMINGVLEAHSAP